MKVSVKTPTALAAVLLLAFSCYNDSKEQLYQNIEAAACDTAAVTYSSHIEQIMQTNCAVQGCHVSPGPQSGIDFSDYNTVKTAAHDGRLVGRITGTTGSVMPPGKPLPPCEIDQIQIWVGAGAPNN